MRRVSFLLVMFQGAKDLDYTRLKNAGELGTVFAYGRLVFPSKKTERRPEKRGAVIKNEF